MTVENNDENVAVASGAAANEQRDEKAGQAGPVLRVFGYLKQRIALSLLFVFTALIVVYFGVVASPRYAAESQFVVKESGTQTELTGLASLGAVTSSTRDSLIIKAFIESRAMAKKLNEAVGLRKHYEDSSVDFLSRLPADATAEEYLEYYQRHITVVHDETSDILEVELQAFDPEFALHASEVLLSIAEAFINDLGDKMAREQMAYAQGEVERAHGLLKNTQRDLLAFQEENRLFNPEQEGGAILEGVNTLQVELIKAQARLKELNAVMRDDSAEVRAQTNLIQSLEQQLKEERGRLTQEANGGFNKINMDFKELALNGELATDLYTSSLTSLESARSQAMQKLKHLLVVEAPLLPEEAKYPRRLYNIITWFVGLMLVYLIGRLLFAVIKEHRD